MKTKPVDICNSNGTTATKVAMPVVCPHCGWACAPIVKDWKKLNYNDSRVYFVAYLTNCCDKIFFCLHEDNKDEPEYGLLLVYPPVMTVALPDNIKELSPRFVNLFNQAAFAEQNNFFELAGTGYRNALEILIKDFAIEKLKKPREEVVKKKLGEAISAFLPNLKSRIAADMIRELGNNYTHYLNKHEDIPFSTLKQYIEILITDIKLQLLILDPVIPSKHLPAEQIQS